MNRTEEGFEPRRASADSDARATGVTRKRGSLRCVCTYMLSIFVQLLLLASQQRLTNRLLVLA